MKIVLIDSHAAHGLFLSKILIERYPNVDYCRLERFIKMNNSASHMDTVFIYMINEANDLDQYSAHKTKLYLDRIFCSGTPKDLLEFQLDQAVNYVSLRQTRGRLVKQLCSKIDTAYDRWLLSKNQIRLFNSPAYVANYGT
jgi:hypothetical protein